MTENQNTPKPEIPVADEDISTETPMGETTTIESLQADLDKMKDQWLRALADAENNRKRAAKEREDTQKFAVTNFARELLSVADNLRRALENCPQTPDLPEPVKALITGVDMTEKEFLNILERHGVKKIDPIHQKFDPNFHQAMFEVETDEHAPSHIVQVLQHGYVLHDRLLRPALVGVSKPSLSSTPKVDTTA